MGGFVSPFVSRGGGAGPPSPQSARTTGHSLVAAGAGVGTPISQQNRLAAAFPAGAAAAAAAAAAAFAGGHSQLQVDAATLAELQLAEAIYRQLMQLGSQQHHAAAAAAAAAGVGVRRPHGGMWAQQAQQVAPGDLAVAMAGAHTDGHGGGGGCSSGTGGDATLAALYRSGCPSSASYPSGRSAATLGGSRGVHGCGCGGAGGGGIDLEGLDCLLLQPVVEEQVRHPEQHLCFTAAAWLTQHSWNEANNEGYADDCLPGPLAPACPIPLMLQSLTFSASDDAYLFSALPPGTSPAGGCQCSLAAAVEHVNGTALLQGAGPQAAGAEAAAAAAAAEAMQPGEEVAAEDSEAVRALMMEWSSDGFCLPLHQLAATATAPSEPPGAATPLQPLRGRATNGGGEGVSPSSSPTVASTGRAAAMSSGGGGSGSRPPPAGPGWRVPVLPAASVPAPPLGLLVRSPQ